MSDSTECYAVIFSSTAGENRDGYDAMAAEMVELAARQPGFLDIEHLQMGERSVTISYWESEEAIRDWKNNERHRIAQARGKGGWYRDYSLKIAKVTRSYSFDSSRDRA